jgi:hypothetical protein
LKPGKQTSLEILANKGFQKFPGKVKGKKMEFENDDFSVIVPDYLINENEESEISSEENEENEENEAQAESIDYSSILQEMNTRLENIETYTLAYNEGINGLLANLYFIDFVAFTVFVFLMLFVVIKFFKTFF